MKELKLTNYFIARVYANFSDIDNYTDMLLKLVEQM